MTDHAHRISATALPLVLFSTAERSAESPTARASLRIGAVLLVAALTAAAAQFSVPLPFTVVPLTLQPMIVLLGGAALGSGLGLLSQVVYLAAGVAGLPVFAASGVLPQGALRLLGPTAGYLMCYPLGAFITGCLAERGLDRRYWTSVLAMTVGLAAIYAGGVLWLAAAPSVFGSKSVGVAMALNGGFYPFLAADLFKLLVAAAVMPGIWRLTGLRAAHAGRA